MDKMVLDDFIKYAKEQFNCEITLRLCDKPDTFAGIFGASFINDENSEKNVDNFEQNLNYENVFINVQFNGEDVMSDMYIDNIGFAA